MDLVVYKILQLFKKVCVEDLLLVQEKKIERWLFAIFLVRIKVKPPNADIKSLCGSSEKL